VTLNRLMWTFGALFRLFGLPLFIVEDTAWARLWTSLCVLSLGCFAFAMAGDGLIKGTIRIQFSLIHRTSQPIAFWAAIFMVSAAGTGAMATAIWAYFVKIW